MERGPQPQHLDESLGALLALAGLTLPEGIDPAALARSLARQRPQLERLMSYPVGDAPPAAKVPRRWS